MNYRSQITSAFYQIAICICLLFISGYSSAQPNQSSIFLAIPNPVIGGIQTPISIGNLYNGANTPSFQFNTFDDGTSHMDVHSTRWGASVLYTRMDPSNNSYGLMQLFGTASNAATLSLFNTTNGVTTQINAGGTTFFNGGAVAIGTQNPGSNQLAVEGTIASRKVIVTQANPFGDYVFDPGYHLSSLDSLSAYIRANHHLPGMPTADSVAKVGLDIGNVQVEAVKKIEEITLYIIEQNKKMAALEHRIEELERR